MITCPRCGETSEPQFDSCWRCNGSLSGNPSPADTQATMKKRVAYKIFRGTFSSWESLFQDASEFASKIRPELLINISHSEDENNGVVVVWYWELVSPYLTEAP